MSQDEDQSCDKSYEHKLWTQAVNDICEQNIWTIVVNKSCEQKVSAKVFNKCCGCGPKVVNKSWEQICWTIFVEKNCEQNVCTSVKTTFQQKLWIKIVPESGEQKLFKKVFNKSCE